MKSHHLQLGLAIFNIALAIGNSVEAATVDGEGGGWYLTQLLLIAANCLVAGMMLDIWLTGVIASKAAMEYWMQHQPPPRPPFPPTAA